MNDISLQNSMMAEVERFIEIRLTSRNRKADDCLTATDIAEHIGIDTKDLNSFLCDKGIQQWGGGRFYLTPKYKGKNLTRDRLFIYYNRNGKKKERTTMVWTPKGAEFILDMVRNRI